MSIPTDVAIIIEMLRRSEDDEICWWCGAQADSREHKLKRSDLVREFGRPPYPESPVRFREGREKTVQGPNSDLVKFKRTMCARCNNERSQPFDRAYDRFAAFLRERERHILASRSLDLRTVYGRAWEAGREGLLRYWAKHVGCRLAENGIEVPEGLRAYLSGGEQPRDVLALEVEIRSDIATISRSGLGGGGLGLGDVLLTDFDAQGMATVVESHIDYRWLRMAWGVGSELSGYPWPFASPIQRLPTGRSVPPGDLPRVK